MCFGAQRLDLYPELNPLFDITLHLLSVLTAPLMLMLFATALHVLRMLSELVLLPTLIVPLKPIVANTPKN